MLDRSKALKVLFLGSKVDIMQSEAQRNNDVAVQPCDGTPESLTWCCGRSLNCCLGAENITRYTIAAQFGDPIPTAISPSDSPGTTQTYSIPSSIAQAPSTAPSVSNTAVPIVNNGLSSGAKAGIGVGAALGVITVIGVGFFVAKAMRWRKQAQTNALSYSDPVEEPKKEIYQYNLDGEAVQQLSGLESQVHELHASGSISELHVVARDGDGVSGDTRI